MRGILEENSRPPSSPASLRMYVLCLPHREKTIEKRSIDYLKKIYLKGESAPGEYWAASVRISMFVILNLWFCLGRGDAVHT